MAKYRIYGFIAASKCFDVIEADSKEEAIDKAWDEYDTTISLCHHCSHEIDAEEIYKFDAEEEK